MRPSHRTPFGPAPRMPEPPTATPTIADATAQVCIVGAGPAGLAQARALKAAGISFDLFERHDGPGGIWDIENPGTPMYETAHLISSKRLSGFVDYAMPAAYPDYPSHAQVLAYLRAFASEHGLDEHIAFGTTVDWAEPDADGWVVTASSGVLRRYQALVCANGMTWQPYEPALPGRFDGELRHAVGYRSPAELKGRRVLVVGGGNTGCDIACDAAAHGTAAYLSLRRGYHFIPKQVFGVPADVFGERGPRLPLRLEQWVFAALLRLLEGDLRRYGLARPDHRIFESHPILNSQVLHHLSHGDLAAKPDIAALRGDRVAFVDGSQAEVDLILLATGYAMTVPYMDREHFEWAGNRLSAYLSAFNRRHETLFTLGFLNTNSGVFADFDRLAHMEANYLLDRTRDPARAARFGALVAGDRTDLTGGIRFVASPRHASYFHHPTFRRHVETVRRKIGWPALGEGSYEALRREVREDAGKYANRPLAASAGP